MSAVHSRAAQSWLGRPLATMARHKSERLGPGCSLIRNASGYYHARFYDPARTPARVSVRLGTTLAAKAGEKARALYRAWDLGGFDPWAPRPGAGAGRAPGDPPPPGGGGVTVAGAVALYVAELERAGRKPSTVRTAKGRLAVVAARLGPETPLASPEPPEWARTYLRPGLSETARYTGQQTVRAFLNWCVRAGHLPVSPLASEKPVTKPRRVPAYLSSADFDRLLASADALPAPVRSVDEPRWLSPALRLAVSSGLRLRELCGLRWGDVETEGDGSVWLRVSGQRAEKGGGREPAKHGSARRVPLAGPHADEALAALALRRRDPSDASEPVVKGAGGGAAYPGALSAAFRRAARLARLPGWVHFHTLRHTYASWLAASGAHPLALRDLLGHRDVTTTQVYAHLAPEHLRAAVSGAFAARPVAPPDPVHKPRPLSRTRR